MSHVSDNLHTVFPAPPTTTERTVIFHRLRKLTHEEASHRLALIRRGITEFHPKLPRDVAAILISARAPAEVINGARREREAYLSQICPTHADREVLIRLFNLTVGMWPADYWLTLLSL